MQFERMLVRFVVVGALTVSMLWVPMPVLAAHVTQPAVRSLAGHGQTAKVTTSSKKKAHKVKRAKKHGRKTAPKKSRKSSVAA
jgi:hypothetical protein